MKIKSVASIFVLLSVIFRVHAADIVQPSFNWLAQINHFSPVGQTFLAEDTSVSYLGLYVEDCNAHLGGNILTYTLFDGSGVGGVQLASGDVTLPDDFHGFLYTDFSGTLPFISLIPTRSYSIQLSSPNARWCYQENLFSNPSPPPGPDYPDGAVIYEGSVNAARSDMAFEVIVLPNADLGITGSGGGTTINNGETVVYTYDINNFGFNDATNVFTDIDFPDALGTVQSLMTSQGVCFSFPCNLDTILKDGTANLTVTLLAQQSGNLTARLVVSADQGDSNLTNNEELLSTTVNPSSDVELTKSVDQVVIGEGGVLNYEILVKNHGPDVISNVQVSDMLPVALLNTQWTCMATAGATCAAGGSSHISDMINLPVGGIASYLIMGDVPDDVAELVIENQASATGGSVADPVPGNNSDMVTTLVVISADGFEQ